MLRKKIRVEQAAQAAMRAGRFDTACAAYAKLIAQGPQRSSIHLAYAGCLTKLKDSQGARRHMQNYYADNPIGPAPEGHPHDSPRVLVVRGLDKTKPTIGRRTDGTYKPKLRGGHFTLRYLLLDDAPARQRVTVVPGIDLDATKLPPHKLMLNAISDADIELGSLTSLASHLDAHPETRVINAPDAVMETTRDGNYNRLLDLPDVHFPRTIRLVLDAPSPKELGRDLRALDFELPVILRMTGTQTGRSTVRIDSPDDLVTFCADDPRGEFYAIQYKQILWRDTYFRKMRLFCIDGVAYPVVCHFDHVWNVHGGNRRTVMKASAELMKEEQQFLRDWRGYIGPKAAAAVEKVFARTPLEFFGMDFTVDTDGGLFIYELNASMRHSFDHAENFPYKKPYDQATSDAFEAMVHRKLQD